MFQFIKRKQNCFEISGFFAFVNKNLIPCSRKKYSWENYKYVALLMSIKTKWNIECCMLTTRFFFFGGGDKKREQVINLTCLYLQRVKQQKIMLLATFVKKKLDVKDCFEL